MRSKQVEVEFPDKGRIVVTMHRLTTGELHKLQDEATDIKIVNGQTVARVLTSIVQENGVLKSIKEAKDANGVNTAITISNIQAMDPSEFNKLHEIFEELNANDLKKND